MSSDSYTFHGYYDARRRAYFEMLPHYRFSLHSHPYVAELVRQLNKGSVRGLQATDTQYRQDASGQSIIPTGKPQPQDYALYQEIFSQTAYAPSDDLVKTPYPVKELDFSDHGAYAVYNWELFFHIPLTIAIHLSKNQQFEEARQWFHYIFDPTDDSDGPTPERFWKVKPFQCTDVQRIEEIFTNLATGSDSTLQQEVIDSIGAWKEAPFRPHLVARYRPSAYMMKTVMAYLDNLIAWGDSLFRQDTGESMSEATQLYVLAANILGPRPQAVPQRGSIRPQTYADLQKDLDAFGNAMRELETDISFDNAPHPTEATDGGGLTTFRSASNALYFCVPPNDKLLGYWDTVADRLFKIHNSLNLQGIFRQLPLFEPPIDPGLLAKATAAGVEIGAVISGAYQPLPLVRFSVLVQKATEICQEVKSLGNNLLSAIEKEDNEALAILRARHERIVLGLAESVKYGQLQESLKAREGLEKSLAVAIARYSYYERLLGKQQSEITIPELEALDSESLKKKSFHASEPEVTAHYDINIDITPDGGVAKERKISSHEAQELRLLENVRSLQDQAATMDFIASYLIQIPEFGGEVEPLGVGASVKFGGQHLSKMLSLMASLVRTAADQTSYEANKTAKIGGYARREQEWAFQSHLAAGEITQIFKQLRAAQIREYVAQLEWSNHQQQIKHAQEIEHFLTGERNPEWTQKIAPGGKKVTNQAFYTWMKREVKGLYAQCFQFAFDIARKAERALQHELGNPELHFLHFNYLAGKEGLLAGEKLYFDIKRMEMAYHENNTREYELTKHVSLLQVNPLALLQLRSTGCCTVSLPEELFDMDGPGHYFRRIKSVAVSIPCVAGPYTSVNCMLTMQNSTIRKTALAGDSYARPPDGEDNRFSDHFGSVQAVVTSSGQNDSGLFETNLRDERYLPFEGSGVISTWQLALPANPSNGDPQQFDYNTISDVIFHIRYTAREGGTSLRNAAMKNLKTKIAAAQTVGSTRLFSIRHEFPSEWGKIKNPQGGSEAALSLKIREEHFPYWSKGSLGKITQVALLSTQNQNAEISFLTVTGSAEVTTLKSDGTENKQPVTNLTESITLPKVPDKFTLNFSLQVNKDATKDDLWLALTWGA